MARILVVDDNPKMRRMLRRMLADTDHEVTEAADGKQALSLFLAHGFDIVVCDLVMPNKEGIETIREIRQHSRSAKILAISGSGANQREVYFRAAAALGADEALAKPFLRAQFLEIIARLLGSAV